MSDVERRREPIDEVRGAKRRAPRSRAIVGATEHRSGRDERPLVGRASRSEERTAFSFDKLFFQEKEKFGPGRPEAFFLVYFFLLKKEVNEERGFDKGRTIFRPQAVKKIVLALANPSDVERKREPVEELRGLEEAEQRRAERLLERGGPRWRTLEELRGLEEAEQRRQGRNLGPTAGGAGGPARPPAGVLKGAKPLHRRRHRWR